MQVRLPLLAVCGTRPEAVKLAPVIHALRGRGHHVILVTTGQHADLAPVMLAEAGLSADLDLGVRLSGAAPPQLLAAILTYLSPVYAAYRPQLALVQGDTVSTLAGALGAAYARVPVAHIEAGLRTGDLDDPHPEELHRRLVAPLASLHFAPTAVAAGALRREGIAAACIHVTGNSGIDALHATVARLAADPSLGEVLAARFPFAVPDDPPLLLVTVHRRENLGPRLQAIATALARLAAAGVRVVLPLHPNPAVSDILRARLAELPNLHLIPPLDHAAMVWMLRRANLLLTDSGGLQEEAPALGVRTLILREATERAEAVTAGAAELVPLQAPAIVAAVRRSLARGPLAPVHPFGDGRSAFRIADAIDNWLGYAQVPHPAARRSGPGV